MRVQSSGCACGPVAPADSRGRAFLCAHWIYMRMTDQGFRVYTGTDRPTPPKRWYRMIQVTLSVTTHSDTLWVDLPSRQTESPTTLRADLILATRTEYALSDVESRLNMAECVMPWAGLEPARPCGLRILRAFWAVLHDLAQSRTVAHKPFICNTCIADTSCSELQ